MNELFEGRYCFEDSWPKGAHIGPKMKFSSIMKNQYMELFWFFYTTYSCINTYNWIIELNDFFERKIFFDTAQKMTFCIKDFFSKCDQIGRKLRIWSHLLKKSLMENFLFCAVFIPPEIVRKLLFFWHCQRYNQWKVVWNRFSKSSGYTGQKMKFSTTDFFSKCD